MPAVLQIASVRLRPRENVLVERRKVRPATSGGRFVTMSRALTAIDVVDTTGRQALEDGLRRGVTHAVMLITRELTALRGGHHLRLLILDDSRDEPRSAAERASHQALRGASDITEWAAGRRIYDDRGELLAVGDLAFEELWLVLEIDGREYHLTAPRSGGATPATHASPGQAGRSRGCRRHWF